MSVLFNGSEISSLSVGRWKVVEGWINNQCFYRSGMVWLSRAIMDDITAHSDVILSDPGGGFDVTISSNEYPDKTDNWAYSLAMILKPGAHVAFYSTHTFKTSASLFPSKDPMPPSHLIWECFYDYNQMTIYRKAAQNAAVEVITSIPLTGDVLFIKTRRGYILSRFAAEWANDDLHDYIQAPSGDPASGVIAHRVVGNEKAGHLAIKWAPFNAIDRTPNGWLTSTHYGWDAITRKEVWHKCTVPQVARDLVTLQGGLGVDTLMFKETPAGLRSDTFTNYDFSGWLGPGGSFHLRDPKRDWYSDWNIFIYRGVNTVSIGFWNSPGVAIHSFEEAVSDTDKWTHVYLSVDNTTAYTKYKVWLDGVYQGEYQNGGAHILGKPYHGPTRVDVSTWAGFWCFLPKDTPSRQMFLEAASR